MDFKSKQMKKSLLTLAAALALVGCSQEDLLTGQQNGNMKGAVGVNTFVSKGTRGVAFNDVDEFKVTENNFDLFAYESNGNQFMGTTTDGIEFAYNNGWDYVDKGEVKFWKQVTEGNTVDFYAVSPANTSEVNIGYDYENGAQTITYTVADNSEDQKDLMYARTAAVDPTSEDIINNGVQINFYHALSQIVFKAKTHEDYLDYINATVTRVEVVKLQNTGTFTFKDAGFEDFSTDYTPWTNTGGEASYVAEVDAENGVEVNSNLTSADDNEAVDLTTSSTALLLLPQEITGATIENPQTPPTSEEGSYFKVTCKVYYTDKNGNQEQIVGTDNNTAEIYIPLTTTWKAGYKYVYTFVFSHNVGNPVTVNENLYVGPWYKDENNGENGDGGSNTQKITLVEGTALYPTHPRDGRTSEYCTVISNVNEVPTVLYSSNGTDWYESKEQAGMSWVTVSDGYLWESDAEGYSLGRSAVKKSTVAKTRSADSYEFRFDFTIDAIQPEVSTNSYQYALQQNAEKGSEDYPFDLSYHNIYGESTQQNTANCYVVNAAGWYSFPVVYGNAIKDYSINSEAFVSLATNSYGLEIDSNSKPDASSVKVLWSSVDNLIESVELETVGEDNYTHIVKFQVNEDNLNEGNAVIAVKNGSGEIVWSWHIWVTPVDLRPVVTNSNTGASAMPVNLGWVSDGSIQTTVTNYVPRVGYVKFKSGDAEYIATVNQTDGCFCFAEGNVNGTSPYYQWGRKDPLYAVDNTTFTATPSGDMSLAVQNPATFYISTTSDYSGGAWYSGIGNYEDTWSAGETSVNNSSLSATVKTIFDPCPVGFAVAAPASISNLGTANDGVFSVDDRNIYVPTLGWLKPEDGTQTGETLFMWTSILKSSTWGCSYTWSDNSLSLHNNAMLGAAFPVLPTVEAETYSDEYEEDEE